MELSPNQQVICETFFAFPESTKNLKYFETKMRLRGGFFLKLQTAKSGVSYMPKKPCVRALIHSQHVKGSERLLKFAPQYLCHIF